MQLTFGLFTSDYKSDASIKECILKQFSHLYITMK